MEFALRFMVELIALGLAGIALLAAITVGLGDVKALSRPLPRIVLTPVLAVLALWILWHGISYIVSG
jgi:hypothetical protein